MNDDPSRLDFEPKGFFWVARYAICLLILGAIAAYFLLTEHSAHFFDALPLLLLLACPLMHVFMHGGHCGHAGNQAHLPGGLNCAGVALVGRPIKRSRSGGSFDDESMAGKVGGSI